MSKNNDNLKLLLKKAMDSLRTEKDSEEKEQKIKDSFLQLKIAIIEHGIFDEFLKTKRIRFKKDFSDIPSDKIDKNDLTFRGQIWKAFLGVNQIDPTLYFDMLDKGIHKKYGRIIKSDSKRYSFIEGTPVRRLWRNFLALCNYMDENNKNFVYCQEYHSFAVYFVNVMPEIDSFYCIIKILTKILPAYFNPKTTALEIGGNLVMESIELLDPALDKHMKSIGFQINFCCMSMLKTLTLLIYNMKSSLRLLDLILVAGPPVIIISLIAKIISKRNCILEFNNSGECFALFQQMKYSEEIDEDGMAHIYFALREEKKLYKKILDLHK